MQLQTYLRDATTDVHTVDKSLFTPQSDAYYTDA